MKAEEIGIPSAVLHKVRETFIIGEPADSSVPFDQWTPSQESIKAIVRAFQSNLQSSISVASVPFKLTHAGVHDRRFPHIYSAERIRQLSDDEISDEERDRRALELARGIMRSRVQEQKFNNGVIAEIVHSLSQTLNDLEMERAALELLRQTAVMVWGALEVVITDTIVEVLNRRPSLVSEALTSETFKRLGLSKAIPIEILPGFNFNLSASMGTIMFGERRLDSLPAIIAVCDDLYKNSELSSKLKDTNLWVLGQRRHLIVHRRGIVDAQYLAKTPDTTPIGEPLIISAHDLDRYLVDVRDVGLLIARSADDLLDEAT